MVPGGSIWGQGVWGRDRRSHRSSYCQRGLRCSGYPDQEPAPYAWEGPGGVAGEGCETELALSSLDNGTGLDYAVTMMVNARCNICQSLPRSASQYPV